VRTLFSIDKGRRNEISKKLGRLCHAGRKDPGQRGTETVLRVALRGSEKKKQLERGDKKKKEGQKRSLRPPGVKRKTQTGQGLKKRGVWVGRGEKPTGQKAI